jgi:hypothetical protein
MCAATSATGSPAVLAGLAAPVAPDQRPPAPATLPVVADARSLRQCPRRTRRPDPATAPRARPAPDTAAAAAPAAALPGRHPVRPGRLRWSTGHVGVGGRTGAVGLRPELQAVDPLTATLAMVDVRWAYLDEAGTARQHSRYRYLLRRSDSGQLAIQVVIDTTPTQPDRDGRDWSQSVELPACPCVGGHPVPPPGNSGHPDATPALGAKLLVRGGLRRCGEPGR